MLDVQSTRSPCRGRRRGLLLALAVASCATTRTASEPDPAPGAEAPSRCRATAKLVSCPQEVLAIDVGRGRTRRVHFQVPLGAAPAPGWPVVLMFTGSFQAPVHNFAAFRDDAYGAYYQALTVKRLLDAGFAVLVPETRFGGSSWWDTNVLWWAWRWSRSPDDRFLRSIFAAIGDGAFGLLDATRLYATGISSGGYMTSRMAESYPGRFKALAIQSASFAKCAGAICVIPTPIPAGHPPTLFLHGGADWVVPVRTMIRYRDALVREGYAAKAIIDPNAGHEWIPAAPDAIVQWFQAWP